LLHLKKRKHAGAEAQLSLGLNGTTEQAAEKLIE
jgi:hypothetical protein